MADLASARGVWGTNVCREVGEWPAGILGIEGRVDNCDVVREVIASAKWGGCHQRQRCYPFDVSGSASHR